MSLPAALKVGDLDLGAWLILKIFVPLFVSFESRHSIVDEGFNGIAISFKIRLFFQSVLKQLAISFIQVAGTTVVTSFKLAINEVHAKWLTHHQARRFLLPGVGRQIWQRCT